MKQKFGAPWRMKGPFSGMSHDYSQVTSSAVFAAKTRKRVLPVPWSMAPTSGPKSFIPPLTEGANEEEGDPSRPLGDVTLMTNFTGAAFSSRIQIGKIGIKICHFSVFWLKFK